MSHLHEENTLRDVVRFETDDAGRLSREVMTVLSGQNLVMGAVVGKIELGTCPTTGTAGSNSGAGICASVTAGAKAKVGTYTIKCVHPVSAGGLFSVKDPNGEALPDAYIGAYVNDQINFTLVDGSPDFAIGDTFTIAIAAGSLSVKEIALGALAAVDGAQHAYGILTADCDASLAAQKAVFIVKDAVIIAANLVWPDGSPAVSNAEKIVALAELYAKGIVARDEA